MGALTGFVQKVSVWRRRFSGSVRHKLLALTLAPLVLGAPILLTMVWIWGAHGYNQLLINKVSSDLGTAHQYFEQAQSSLRTGLEGVANSYRLARALGDERFPEGLNAVLRVAAEDLGLDYLLLLDARGQALAGAGDIAGERDRRRWPVVQDALQGYAAHGLEVFSPEDLQGVNPELPPRAYLPLRPTRNATPDDRQAENRGLMLHVAAPIYGADGLAVGALEGGALLNGSQGIVDRINAIVYREASLPLGSRGAATLFLGDARIATNVQLFDSGRALGTRASQAVADKVLGRGEAWLGSAFVVNDTYVSGYEPLTDTAGRRVGMLYVGFLEAPLKNALYVAMAGLFCLFLAVSGVGAIVALHWARTIFRPLERMNRVIERVEAGDEAARTGPTASLDELGRLSRAFDQLLDSIAARRWELQRWAQELDRKVAERTIALEEANTTLRQAQQQLVMREKLAAIGELTAGVAHEINNPVAVIQGNLDVLREELGSAAEPVSEELRLIDRQTERIQAIVTKLLQFARPGDFAGSAEAVDVNAVINDCVVLTRHNIRKAGVTLETRLNAVGQAEITSGELQQVLINLIVNAVQATPPGGKLQLESRDITQQDWRDDQWAAAAGGSFDGVLIRVRDNGQGIAAADIDRIFNPFFTTKKHNGNGLGLSISYAIIQRYGGRIAVDSAPGAGSVFTLWLRRRALYEEGAG